MNKPQILQDIKHLSLKGLLKWQRVILKSSQSSHRPDLVCWQIGKDLFYDNYAFKNVAEYGQLGLRLRPQSPSSSHDVSQECGELPDGKITACYLDKIKHNCFFFNAKQTHGSHKLCILARITASIYSLSGVRPPVFSRFTALADLHQDVESLTPRPQGDSTSATCGRKHLPPSDQWGVTRLAASTLYFLLKTTVVWRKRFISLDLRDPLPVIWTKVYSCLICTARQAVIAIHFLKCM